MMASDVYFKAVDVINSCTTVKQTQVAESYLDLTKKVLGYEAYDILYNHLLVKIVDIVYLTFKGVE